MDIISVMRSTAQDYGLIFSDAWWQLINVELHSAMILYITAGFITVILMLCYTFYRRFMRNKERQNKLLAQSSYSSGDMRGLRFRKRDKIVFYGRRMLRKVKNVSGQMYGGQGRKRRAVMRFAKRLLQLRKETVPVEMKTVEPPAEYLQETVEETDGVPPDVLYMLQSIRIFGHFEKPIFLKLSKHIEVLTLQPGDFLFKITDEDDSVFIVQSGQINVFIANADGSTLSLKTIKEGESVTSLLSFVDVLSDSPSFYKTVTAKATEQSTVIRLPMEAFREVFNENPDIMIRVIQVIMIRLQRVLFTALRNYLGLNSELVQNHMRQKKLNEPGAITHQLSKQSFQPQPRQSHYTPRPSMQPKQTIYQQQRQQPNYRHSIIQTRQSYTPYRRSIEPIQHSLSAPAPAPDMMNYDPTQFSLPFVPHPGNLLKGKFSTPTENNGNETSGDMHGLAVESFLKELGLPDEDRSFLEPFVELRQTDADVTLIEEGNCNDICVWYVMSGLLAVYQCGVDPIRNFQPDTKGCFIHHVHPGEIVGALAVLTGEASVYTISTLYPSQIAFIRRAAIYQIMRERPKIVLDLGSGVVRRLSPLVRQCDYALDWIFLESGRAVYRQDEASDCTYIVLSGRMRSVITQRNGKKEIVGEYGKGDLVGIVEMITLKSRTTTVMAVRDSELAKLPEGLFNAIKLRYPIVVTKLISLLSHRILGSMQAPSGNSHALESNTVTHKYATVALVPVSEDVPLTAFTYELFHSLCAIGPTLRLTSEVVRKQLGVHILEQSNEYRLTSWLAQQEDRYIITLYQSDASLSAWTQRCMRQADVILIVGKGDSAPTVGKFEREIDRLAIRTQKELVLLYSETDSSKPSNTLQWLNVRPWVTKHHHIQCARRIFTRKSQYRINDLYSRVLMSEPNMHSDFSRLARWLTGNSIGLVLGGGGARGAAHIGMLKAIQEAGIPIDMVGGVSIGAFMGGLWCAERNLTTVTQKAREWCNKMTKWFAQLLDLTYPITSMFSGREFNKTIRDTFGDVMIEDLWLPYFNLTTDITASSHRVHTNGSLWRYIRSSMSLSGYMPPLCDPKDGHLLLDGGYTNNLPGYMWRYVRASMSVAGVLPPFCDYKDGHLLLDGCYANNVPADVMHNLGAAHVMAIDVASHDDSDLTNYGDELSGWWLLYKKWNPFTTPVKVPDLPDIQSRLAYVSCNRQLKEVKNSDYCEYMRPPIQKYKTLSFGSFDEIRDVGYVYGKSFFEEMAKDGRLGRFNQWFIKEPPKKYNPASLSEYTFIDLAQTVCKIPDLGYDLDSDEYDENNYLYSEDEEFDGYISEPSIYNRNQIKMKRTGTSLSLSENEMDSDIELDLSVPLKKSHVLYFDLNSDSRKTPKKSPSSEDDGSPLELTMKPLSLKSTPSDISADYSNSTNSNAKHSDENAKDHDTDNEDSTTAAEEAKNKLTS